MRLEKVLEKLEELFRKWGLGTDDWILIATYALRLQRYEVKIRKGHLNTIVNKNKLPWKVGEGYEVFPPKDSEGLKEFSLWMKSTSFDTDLIVYNPQRLKRLLKDTVFYQLPNGRKIRLLSMIGELKSLDEYLGYCTKQGVGEEKGRYLLKIIDDMKRASKQKGNKREVLLADSILKKYKYLRKVKKFSVKQAKELKGIAVFKGKVTGKVRVILRKEDKIEKIEKGRILVTKMTSAKLTNILSKIKAIVTDDGGRLCHAAILSREFKIPCIVGAKIATKVLKDGDLVEVDAEKGIVKILEKAK